MRFVKAHGTGNDFVLLPDLDGALELSAGLVQALCAPHLGLGADGVIRIAPPDPDLAAGQDADVFMDYRNADGGAVEMCGNGVRCVAKYVLDRGMVAGDTVRVLTRSGVKTVQAARGADGKVVRVRVDMGAPSPGGVNQPLDVRLDGVEQIVRITTLSMGNPHAVLVVDDVDAAPVRTLGPVIEGHPAFPDRTNVEFIAVPSRDRVEGRIWERGVGETLASGTGSSAMAVAAHLLGLADRRVTVALPGGEIAVEWTDDTLFMEGPAVEVAEGELGADWLAAVEDA
ncbi:MAG TPA: diaminopimelate epimerase [Egibacteraceae bacterium]|nr:diaminopimelate epimerase [Egibacteraceae bacterium]